MRDVAKIKQTLVYLQAEVLFFWLWMVHVLGSADLPCILETYLLTLHRLV